MKLKHWRPELVTLIILAAITRLWHLFRPGDVVFDEVYFKAFAAHYLDGHYYFDIHPPLGKLLLAGFAHLANLTPEAMLTSAATVLRLVPALAGIILIPLIWGILRRLGASRPFAFLGAALVLFDNALLVESRFILMDTMLLLFGLGAIYCYLAARTTPQTNVRWLWLALAALSAGAATSIKWTGVSALAVIGVLWLFDQRRQKTTWTRRLSEIAILSLLPVALYVTTFAIHFHLLPSSGDGDAFMSQRFQQTLAHNPSYNPQTHLGFWPKFIELNQEMYRANQTLTATHPYGSHWYTWPLEQRPIYYWQGATLPDGRQGNIYLLGNPVIWWGLWTAAVAGLLYARLIHHRFKPATRYGLALSAGAYLLNLMPFMAVSRVMFLYHYFFSFCFSIIFVILLWNDLAPSPKGKPLHQRKHQKLFAAAILAVVMGFVFFAPLSYGTPLSPAGLQARIWLPSWR